MKTVRCSLFSLLLLAFFSCQKERAEEMPQVVHLNIPAERDGAPKYRFSLQNPTVAYAFLLEVRPAGGREIVAQVSNDEFYSGNQSFLLPLDQFSSYNATLTIWSANTPGKLDWELKNVSSELLCAKGSQNYIPAASAAVYLWNCM